MKMTFNRRLILEVLANEIEGTQPPHGASSIGYALKTAFNYKWGDGLYPGMVTLPNKRQIHRTLKELWQGGFIVGARVKVDGYSGQLPYWEVEYQLCNEVYKNSLITECNALHQKIDKAKYGVNFFGSVFDMGLQADEVATLATEVKRLLQRTHPDKAHGYDVQFKQMIQCRDWIKDGIPPPAPTDSTKHQA
ncbi:MAG: hypothetical protein Q7U18_13715 [Methylobacter sp.]|nr:hypothetical protein [Methylobacter sp.]